MKKLRFLFTFPINILSLALLLTLFFAIDSVLAELEFFDLAQISPAVTGVSHTRMISDTVSANDATMLLATATSSTGKASTPQAVLTILPTARSSAISLSSNPLDATTNILVLGSDQRMGDSTWRTDVVMIVALDSANARAGVISIPRDIYLDNIPLHQPNRINVVDYLGQGDDPDGGGPALMATILEEKLEIRLDYYIRFGFESFKELVDALGGVRVVFDCPVSDEIPAEDIFINLPAGEHTLDGSQALAYVRTRRQGGDLARVRRQQRLVWALRQQMREENWLPRLPVLYRALSESVQTDIGLLKAVDLARVVMDLDETQVYGLTLASPELIEEAWRNGMSVLLLDWETAAVDMQGVFERAQFEETNTVGPAGDRAACP